MKFSQLPIGARFEFEGKVYVKTGPIAASSDQGGQRMIPRYAVLRPLDGSAPVAPPKSPRSLDEVMVRKALEAFYQDCDRLLDGSIEDDGRLDEARKQLTLARDRFLTALASNG